MTTQNLANVEEERTVTADTNDVMGSTALRQAPGPGAIAVYLASTVADSEAAVTVGGRSLKRKSIIGKVGTNAQVDVAADTPLISQVRGGEPIIVDIDVVTAGTIRVKVQWVGAPL